MMGRSTHRALSIFIRKNRFYIMALTHVLIEHNYTLYTLFALTFFNEDAMNKEAPCSMKYTLPCEGFLLFRTRHVMEDN